MWRAAKRCCCKPREDSYDMAVDKLRQERDGKDFEMSEGINSTAGNQGNPEEGDNENSDAEINRCLQMLL